MILEALESLLLTESIRLLFRNQIETVRKILISRDANKFAKKRLQASWENVLINVHYDYVLNNFYVSINEIVNMADQNTTIPELEDRIRNLILERSKNWTENRPDENTFNKLLEDYFKSITLYYIFHHEGIAHLIIYDKLDEILRLLTPKLRFKKFQPIQKYLNRKIDHLPDRNLFTKRLIFFNDKEKQIIQTIKKTLTGEDSERNVLLIGAPASGKTVMSLSISIELSEQGYHLYFYSVRNRSDSEIVLREMFENDLPNFIYVFDNCQQNILFTNEIIEQVSNLNNAACLFISRDLPKKIRCLEEFDNEDFFQKFKNRRFILSYKDLKTFESKVIGIIENYKKYYESENKIELKIGDIKRAVNNSHKNLLTLYFNLRYWTPSESLSRINKTFVLKEIYNHYLEPNNKELILIISSLYQFEIHFHPNSQQQENEISILVQKGLLSFDDEFKSYYFYHSDFAKLLIRSYEIQKDFSAYYTDPAIFAFEKIKDYISGFDKYPPNLEEVFHNLVRNRGLAVAIKLLNDPIMRLRLSQFYYQTGSIVKLLFVLYRLQDKNYKIVKEIAQQIPEDVWIKKLREFSISGLAHSLMCLNATYPEKAQSLTQTLDISDIIKSSKNSNIVSISNALIEMNKANQIHKLGSKVYANFDITILVDKINKARFEHVGKSLSELRKIQPGKTKIIYDQLDINRILKNAQKVGLKALGKTLRELNVLERELRIKGTFKSELIYKSISDEQLLKKTEIVSLEGLGRALSELKDINFSKTKRVYRKIDTARFVNEIAHVRLHQIGHTLSELRNIDRYKTREIFYQCDTKRLTYRITDQSLSIQQISYALLQFYKIDTNKNKLNEIIQGVQVDYFVKKFRQASFANFCIALDALNKVDDKLILNVLNKIPFDTINEKATKEKFENLGRSLNKLFFVNEEYARKILNCLHWNRIVMKGPTLRFDKFGDCLSNLFIVDNNNVVEIFRSIDFDFILKMAKNAGKSELLQGLSKLKLIDSVLIEKIELGLKRFNPRISESENK